MSPTEPVSPTTTTKKGISASVLKWIAVVSMLIDHMTAGLLDNGYWGSGHAVTHTGYILYYILRGIGRIAFPIYCFLIVEGYFHTRNKWKFLARLAVFSIISEIPFDICFHEMYFDWSYQNVFLTLAIGLLGIIVFDLIVRYDFQSADIVRKIAAVGVIAAAAAAAELLNTDYSAYGVAIIFLFFFFRNNEILRNVFVSIALTLLSTLEAAAVVIFIPLHFYNGQRGRQNKYLFYILYPAHLLLIAAARGYFFGIFVK